MADINYGRNYRLEFVPEGGGGNTVKMEQVGVAGDGLIPGVAIGYQIGGSFPNLNTSAEIKCDLGIYNLTAATARALQEPGTITFSLGYSNTVTPVFIGKLQEADITFEGNDVVLALQLSASNQHYQDRYFSKQYKKGQTKSQIIKDLKAFVEGNPLGSGNVPSVQVQRGGQDEFEITDDAVLKSARTYGDDALKVLARLLPNYYIYTTSNNTLNVVKRENRSAAARSLFTPTLEFGPDTGQIGRLQFIGKASKETKKQVLSGVTARSVLNTEIFLNRYIKIVGNEPDTAFNSLFGSSAAVSGKQDPFIYRVTAYQHSGNTFRGESITTWTGELINSPLTSGGL